MNFCFDQQQLPGPTDGCVTPCGNVVASLFLRDVLRERLNALVKSVTLPDTFAEANHCKVTLIPS